MIRRQSGALLLMVALLLATLAALSFGLNRAAAMDAAAVQGEYQARAAAYLAEAAVATAIWSNQAKGCKSEAVGLTPFGAGAFSAEVTKGGSKNLNIVATGMVGDLNDPVRRKVERREVNIVDFTKTDTKDLGGAALDTTIDSYRYTAEPDRTDLALVSGTSQALLSWPAGEISRDVRVLSATLILTQNGASAVSRQVAVHRVMTQWDGNATWRQPRPGQAWSGGDYGSTPVAATAVAATGTVTWDVTSLVDGWATRRFPNYGMLLRLANPGQAATFYSRDATSGRPVLRVVTTKPC
jgi:hypothetical protein